VAKSRGDAYVARLFGSARRECIEYMIVLSETHLRRLGSLYADYCEAHMHLSLWKDAPIGRSVERFGRTTCRPVAGRLHCRTPLI
jgi:hypothetical protein